MKGKRLGMVLLVFLIGLVIFLFETRYVTCDMYVFRHEKFGHKLIVVNGIDHIGDEISIDNEKIQLNSEIIKYSLQKDKDKDHFYLEKVDGTQREIIGVSKENVSFKSTNDASYGGTSSDGASVSDELNFYSAVVMSYVVLQRLFVNLLVCGGLVVLFVVVATLCYKRKK